MKNLFSLLMLFSCVCLYGQKSGSPALHKRLVAVGEAPAAVSEYTPVDKGRILCYLSNSDDYLYVDMIITDPVVQKKVLDVGMNIWIDVTGKERKVLSARYPVGANTIKEQLDRKAERMTTEEMRMLALNSSTSMAYEVMYNGYDDKGTRTIPAKTESGCNGSVRYNDDGDLIYFVAVPLEGIEFHESKGKPVPFSLGIEYGVNPVIVRPQPAAGGGAAGGVARAGGGMPPGGMPPGQQTGEPVCWIKGLIPPAEN